jgi:HD-GYP domain-containing protein (c-di-GMP phosphodiesterase class II)
MTREEVADILARQATLNAIGVALSSERDVDALLEHILEAAREAVNADAGTLYRVKDDSLVFEVVRNVSLGYSQGGKHGAPIEFPPLPLRLPDGRGNTTMVAALAALSGKTVNIEDVYAVEGFDVYGFDFSGTRRFDAITGYRSRSFLTIPMKDHNNAVVGVLQLINAKNADGSVRSFSREDQHLVESLASQAAIAVNNRQLINQLERLLESLIDVINTAIDEKSPHTGGHCKRVPTLTMLLAEAAVRTQDGPLADFTMSEADRYELKIAGLLHDCGKIVTPAHVVEKATKLHTLFDRIGLIDTRYEVLIRDAEIACLKGEITPVQHSERVAQLLADRDILRHCNIGREAMDEAKLQDIARISSEHWRPHGGELVSLLSADEIENLSIKRGTLTRAEREIINHHIVMTIRMLEGLPWPLHLANVPEYAGGHHERMDGKGYPKGLTREELSIPARIMGIADIFEALTSPDRPYKTANTLSESLAILGRMKVDNHIDPDLFEVFLREGIYLEYARRFIDPNQIDDVDWAVIPGVDAALAEWLGRRGLSKQ